MDAAFCPAPAETMRTTLANFSSGMFKEFEEAGMDTKEIKAVLEPKHALDVWRDNAAFVAIKSAKKSRLLVYSKDRQMTLLRFNAMLVVLMRPSRTTKPCVR